MIEVVCGRLGLCVGLRSDLGGLEGRGGEGVRSAIVYEWQSWRERSRSLMRLCGLGIC